MEAQLKSAPAGAETPVTPGLTEPMEGSAMKYRTRCECGSDHKQIIFDRIVIANSGCWEWQRKPNREGYGTHNHVGVTWPAHRLSYFAFRGLIPEGLVLDHLCRNRLCVNPQHLEAVTHQVNILRGIGVAATYARRDVCANGHPLDDGGANASRRGRPCRRCKSDAVMRLQRSRDGLPDGDPRHGTTNGYINFRCRCAPCRQANTDAMRRYQATKRGASK